MTCNDDVLSSALIVSASEQFETIVRKSLKGVISVENKKNGATARQCILNRYYEIIVINAPLPDESGEELALDIVEKCNASVLLVVPSDLYEDYMEHVTDDGILVIAKPSPKGRIDKAIRFLISTQKKIRKYELKVESVLEKMEEMRIVSRAKILLVEKKHMSEDEAHKYIGKLAMDSGISRGRAAERLLDEYE